MSNELLSKLNSYVKNIEKVGFSHGEKEINVYFEEGKIIIEQKGQKIAIFKDDQNIYDEIGLLVSKIVDGHISLLPRKKVENLIIDLLVNIIVLSEIEDEEGFSHSQRMAKLAREFGKYIGFSEEEIRRLEIHAYLHDVGKISLEQLMLYSPTRITLFESNYQDHTVMGSVFLSMIDILWEYIPTVRHHHERWDGKGYPDGLKGEEIPYFARIISVLDYYDEITNFISSEWESRIKTPSEAVEMIQNLSGTYFDPKLVDKFVLMMRERGVV
ncbi:HD domain-containing protein [Thermosipho ferrireducens]|uniref:HD domain-containing protein n=1 Tax=Thermosipho ferrireducens TaxID=2571116 RepID=A0ABX7S9G2_9BACT|nr:HD domain-containing protein [Thermosipho ferrireducens]